MALPPAPPSFAPVSPPKRVLLRSSWQTVNIGDIGHTPGILRLLASILPLTQVTLWPGRIDRGVREMLHHHFPDLGIVEGDTDATGRPTTAALTTAFAEHDFFLHGSGPSLVAQQHVQAWRSRTEKPYGIYGVTIDPVTTRAGRATEGATLPRLREKLDRLRAAREQARGGDSTKD